MADPYVRETGAVLTVDGNVRLGVDYDTVSLLVAGQLVRLTADQQEEFAQLFVGAVWQAGQQKARMDGEAPRTACTEPHTPDRRCFDCATDAEMAAAIPPPPGERDA
jgi:hypothetical protein